MNFDYCSWLKYDKNIMNISKSKLLQLIKRNWLYFLIFLLIFCYFGIFRYFLIPSGDDYFWWGTQGEYLLHHGFYGPIKIYGGSINGRYLGNFLEILTMRHLKLAVIVFGGFWTLLIWTIWQLSGKTWWSLVLACGFIFTLNDAFLNTILVWNAGFINYVPPMALLLLYLVIVQKGEQQHLSAIYALLTLGLGLTAGLFLESITICQIFLGLILLVFFTSHKQLYHFTYLLGAILSFGMMFSHPGYRLQVPYRQKTFDLSKIWHIYTTSNHIWLISLNTILLAILLVAIIVLAWQSQLSKLTKGSLLLGAVIFLIYYLFVSRYLHTVKTDMIYDYLVNIHFADIDAIVSLLLIGYIGCCIYYLLPFDKMIWLFYVCAGLFFGPLLFVAAPVNCRGIFPTYVFMYLIMIKFVQTASHELKINRLLLVITMIMVAGAATHYQIIMQTNYEANLMRVQEPAYVQRQRLLNKHVPYRKFVWVNDRFDQQNPDYWNQRLKRR